MDRYTQWITWAAQLVEGAGVLVILFGALIALGRSWYESADRAKAKRVASAPRREPSGPSRTEQREGPETWYRLFRNYLGRAILLGLELLVAADIIRTITHRPDLGNVLALGLIVVIRTFLSFTLQLEVEGRWPWQRPSAELHR